MSDLVFVGFPLALVAHSVWRLRGIWRITAIGCLFVVVAAFATDMQGIHRGGNLAGMYTMMLARPVLLFWLALHASYLAAHTSRHLPAAAAKLTSAAISVILVFGGVMSLWSFVIDVPICGQILGGLPHVSYWTVGGLLALVTAAYSFRATVKPHTTEEHVQPSTQRPMSPAARYTMATLSSVVYFVGALYLVYAYAPLGFPALRQINRWILFAVAGLLALVTAVCSFRALVKPRSPEQTSASPAESGESE